MEVENNNFDFSPSDFYVNPNYLDSILINQYGSITDGEVITKWIIIRRSYVTFLYFPFIKQVRCLLTVS